MKKERKNTSSAFVIIFALVIVLLLLLLLTKPKSDNAKPVLSLSAPSAVRQDQEVRVDVHGSNFDRLAGVQFSISYDPKVLSYMKAEEGAFLRSGGSQTFFFDIGNRVATPGFAGDIVVTKQGSGASGRGLIASLYFTALAEGSSDIQFDKIMPVDTEGNAIDANVQSVAVQVIS